MTRRLYRTASVLALIGLAAELLPTERPAYAGDQLTVTSFGGAYQAGERKAFFEPYAKQTGVKITDEEYNGEVAKIRAMVESKSVSWDLVESDAMLSLEMCADGTLETIDWTKLGLDRTKFTEASKYDCAVPSSHYTTILAYDKDKLTDGPKTIADLFDLQKFPGKRGLARTAFGTLEWALIADGVAIKDVYKVLGTPAGVDRAFKKLDTIKKDVIWWQAGAQAAQLLADGQVSMTAAWMTRIYDANKSSGKHFQIVWDAQALGMNVWVIPKGGPRRDDAYKFLAFAASPSAQAELSRYTPVGPANSDAIPLVDPKILPDLPNAPDHMTNVLVTDPAFWGDKGPELRERFTAWLAK